ncbi:PAS domain-containing protein, partial [bacterium]|nr:PAS domain-containing protein [bacterium]
LKKELKNVTKNTFDSFNLKRSLDFLLEFGDRIHNKKEENYLFPVMIERGIPKDGPIRVMLMEHEAERKLLQQMSNKVDGLREASAEVRNQFKSEGLDYLKIRAEHIWKENDVLYKMGARALTDDDKKKLVMEFIQLNKDHYGETAAEQFEKMVQEVEKGQKGRKSLVQNLSYEQMDAIMETLPIEVTFVDANDTVVYFNRLDKEKVFVRTRSVIGRKVHMCHPAKSVHVVEQIVSGFKNGTLDKAEFWIDFKNDKILIRYFPVRNEEGEYLGVLEVTQEVGWIQKLEGQKRLLD